MDKLWGWGSFFVYFFWNDPYFFSRPYEQYGRGSVRTRCRGVT